VSAVLQTALRLIYRFRNSWVKSDWIFVS
jgi:hypothetical protein